MAERDESRAYGSRHFLVYTKNFFRETLIPHRRYMPISFILSSNSALSTDARLFSRAR